MKLKKYIWTFVGLAMIGFSSWLLYHELRGLSLDDLWESLIAINVANWICSSLSTFLAYAALAGYDRIALQHLGHKVNWSFIALTSFTTYAISHNIGASIFSGAVVRYRAYTSKGLSAAEVGILVGLCSFTFVIGTIMLMGLVLLYEPDITERFTAILSVEASITIGIGLLVVFGLYVLGSFLKLRPLKIGSFFIHYPAPKLVVQQLIIGPIELIGAAGIIYFALPEVGNPGFMIILGIFLISFSAALISHAPGGIGVMELVFFTGLPDMNQADVVTALLIFRLFYLIIPFVTALFVILFFERSQLAAAQREEALK